jgi:hypothetical protein
MKLSYLTRKGSKVLLMTDTAAGSRPLIGAYYSGEDWVPCSWLENGQYRQETEASLDLVDYQ